MNIAVFTIVTRNHLHRARVLMASVAHYLPEAQRFVVLADNPARFIQPAHEGFTLVTPAELEVPRYRAMAFALDPASLCYALKACSARYLQQRCHASTLYFDSDTRLYARPDELINRLGQHPFILTPHLIDPKLNAPAKVETMRSGAFNGGVFAAAYSKAADDVLNWWHAQLWVPDNVQASWNHDQGWLNLIPPFFPDVYILRDAGYNVAFWNLHERRFAQTDQRYSVNEVPLVVFHFSYFDARQPEFLAARFRLAPPNIAVSTLLQHYAGQLIASGEAECSSWGTDLSRFRNGRPLTSRHRAYFRDRLWNVLPDDADPFDPKLAVPGLRGLKSLYNSDHWLTVAIRRWRG